MQGKTEIIIQEELSNFWGKYFDQMQLKVNDKGTMLYGFIKDEAHLHGILSQIKALNLTLISINPVKTDN